MEESAVVHSDKWKKNVEECVKDLGYSTYEINYDLSTEGRNYFGVANHVLVEGIKNGVQSEDYLFIKAMNSSKERNKMLAVSDKYDREMFMYKEVLPKFDDMQKDLLKIYKYRIPKMYRATNEYIIMEDLRDENYKEFDQKKLIDFDHTAVLLEDLARFHALSFALKERNPEVFANLSKDLKNLYFNETYYKQMHDDILYNIIIKHLDNEDVKECLLKTCERNGSIVLDLVFPENADNKYSVICHGDPHYKNALFQYDESDLPTECVMLDYQFSFLSSPVTDIFYMMVSSVSPDVWSQYDRLLDIYYDCLTLTLNKYQCKVKDLYPREVFKKDLERFYPFAISIAVINIRAFARPICNEDETTKALLSLKFLEFEEEEANAIYKQRINGIMAQFKTMGII